MSHISKDQLLHIAKLCRIELSDEDITHLLPQLDNIIWFVGKLQECDIEGVEPYVSVQDDVYMECLSWTITCDAPDEFLSNIQHPIVDHAIQITNKLKQV